MARYKYDESIYIDGRRYRVQANTKKDFAQKMSAVRERAEKSTYKNITVREWREEWVEEYKRPDVSDDWYLEIKRYLKKLREIDHLRIADVKPIHLKKILNKESGKSFSSVKKVHDIFCSLFRQAYIEDITSDDITKGITMPSYKRQGMRRSITQKEREAFISAIPKHDKGILFAIMLFAGLRPSEVRALRYCDIDRERMEITVNKSMDKKRAVKDTKTVAGVRKVIYFPELNNFLKNGSPFDFVVSTKGGEPLDGQGYKRAWKSFKHLLHVEMGGKLYRNAIVPPYTVSDDLTPYCLRHTYCTDLQKAGVPINIAKEMMGHEDISTTSKIYTHYDDGSASIAREKITGEALESNRHKALK